MSYYDVYVGDLSDPEFKWEKVHPGQNIPRHISSNFPHWAPFHEVLAKIDSGEWAGKWTDWGAAVARVTGREIKKFVAEYYKDYEKQNEGFPHLIKQWEKLKKTIEPLEDDKEYGLVAAET